MMSFPRSAVLLIAGFSMTCDPSQAATGESFQFSAPLYTVNEADGTAPIVIQRVGGTSGEARVTLSTTNGSATSAGDFTAVTSREVIFAEGDDVETVDIDIANPLNASETNEAFTVTLSNPTHDTVLAAPSSATVRIIDSTTDTVKPAIIISTPASGANIPESAGPTVTVTGTASDAKGVAEVQVRLNGGAFTTPPLLPTQEGGPSVAYSATLTPVPGPNVIEVKSIDTATNESAITTRTFTYVVVRNLVVGVSPAGAGSVTTGFLGTTSRQVAKAYSITALPAAGRVFDGWTVSGGPSLADIRVSAGALEVPALAFTFREGLELTANFIPNPFTSEAGVYHGRVRSSLSAPAGGTTPSTSTEGHMTATLMATGAFSGKLSIDGLVLGVAGIFDNDGRARFGTSRATTLPVNRPGKPSLVLELTLTDLDAGGNADTITGTVTQNYRTVITAVSEVRAKRAAFNGTTALPPAQYLGAANANAMYTAIIEPQPLVNQPAVLTESDYPQGTGYATITVSKTGSVVFVGTLADGTTPVSISSSLSKDLDCPLFAQIYAKLGFMAGELDLDASNPESDMTAAGMLWSRPYQPTQHYLYGWPEVIKVDLEAARYVATAGESVLRTPDGTTVPNDADDRGDVLPNPDADGNADLEFSGPFMPVVSKDVALSIADIVTKIPATDASFTLSIARSTGVITGTFTRADDLTKPSYKGIIYQKGSAPGGYGFFLTVTPAVKTYDGQGGAIRLLSQP